MSLPAPSAHALPATLLSVWAFNLTPALPRGSLTPCPQLYVGMPPRLYIKIGLYSVVDEMRSGVTG